MSIDPDSNKNDELQFTTAEPAAAANGLQSATIPCVLCGQPIGGNYFALADKPLCPACHARVTAATPGSKPGRVLKAGLLGFAAGMLGAFIWFVIRRVAHIEVGLVAILVGFMVGSAVRKGSGGRGGRAYQILAVVLTYCCIAANYLPDIFEAAFDAAAKRPAANANAAGQPAAPPDAAASNPNTGNAATDRPKITFGQFLWAMTRFVVVAFGIALAAPFLGGAENLIGILIIGFALWEAWRLTARRELPISGPYQLGTQPTA